MMARHILLKVAGSETYTLVDRQTHSVEEIRLEEADARISSAQDFDGVELALALPGPLEISAGKLGAIVAA